MIKVMFTCHGNICRSPMAECILKDMVQKRGVEGQFLIASSATSREEIGNSLHPGAVRKLDEMGIVHQRRQAVQLTKADYDHYDYILCMDRWNLKNILRIIGRDSGHKVQLLLAYTGQNRDIADPWYTGNFDETYEDLVKGCEAFLEELGL